MKNFFNFIIIAIITFFSSWSLFQSSFYNLHDHTHAGRIAEMTQALRDGQFPVIWSSNFGFGYGMPLFLFYAPLPYYVGAFFFFFHLNIVLVIKILYFLINFFSALGSFYLAKTVFKNNKVAIVTSTAFTFFSYRALNLFVRGALSEIVALMFLPWILAFTFKIIKGEKNFYNYFKLVLVWTGLFLSHNLTTMMFVPFYWFFVVGIFFGYKVFLKNKFNWLFLKRLLGIFLLACGLASFYLIPSFWEKNSTYLNDLTLSYYFNFHHHFLYIRQFFRNQWGYGGSEYGPNDQISFYLGTGQILALIIVSFFFIKLFYLLFKKKILDEQKKLFGILLITFVSLCLSLWLTLEKSKFVWENISIFQYLQFPWRYLTIANVFLSLLVGASVLLFKKGFLMNFYTLFITCLIIVTSYTYFQGEKLLDNAEEIYYTDSLRIRNELSNDLMDYFPKQKNNFSTLANITSIRPVENLVLNSDLENYQILVNRNQEKLVQTNFNQLTKVNFGIVYFDGWKIEIDGVKQSIEIDPKIGNIIVSIPRGEHLVAIYLQANAVRMGANLISLISVVIVCSLNFYFMRESKKNKI